MESSLGEHIATMVDVFEHARRVLKPTGTLWLNYGDSYASGINGRSAADTKAIGNDDRTFRDKPFSTVGGVLKPKDLCMVPNRLAIALQDAGWWVRSEIIWHKPNPMPESIRDRPTSSHEKLWLLAKSERYFYDADAIAEPLSAISLDQISYFQKNGARDDPRDKGLDISRRDIRGLLDRKGRGARGAAMANQTTRNKRNVWTIPSLPFPDAHFATFPPALVEPCILAGCPDKVCANCGKPWVRVVEIESRPNWQGGEGQKHDGTLYRPNIGGGVSNDRRDRTDHGFSPSCLCDAGGIPGTVLDPFGGAGTTGMVADRLGRNAILIELNPAYAEMTRARLVADAGMFAEITLHQTGETP
jgi:DNA modification methylase